MFIYFASAANLQECAFALIFIGTCLFWQCNGQCYDACNQYSIDVCFLLPGCYWDTIEDKCKDIWTSCLCDDQMCCYSVDTECRCCDFFFDSSPLCTTAPEGISLADRCAAYFDAMSKTTSVVPSRKPTTMPSDTPTINPTSLRDLLGFEPPDQCLQYPCTWYVIPL